MNYGNLYTVSAPSGAGKTSLVKAAIADLDFCKLSVSHTTRTMRPKETPGSDYHFVSTDEFAQLVSEDAFLEHAKVFDHFYGTSETAVNQVLDHGHDVILEIDWQGALQIKQRFPDSTAIFILPPSIQTLLDRLVNRQQDNQAVIERRMRDAKIEISHYKDSDYLIINDQFDQALNELKAILMAQRLRTSAQILRQQALIQQLVR